MMNKSWQFPIGCILLLCVSGCSKTSTSNAPTLSKTTPIKVKPAKVLSPAKPERAIMTIPAWAEGKVVTEVKLKPGVKAVAITFDDGPWPKYSLEVLKVLKKYNVKATFFEVGKELSRRPDVAREIVAAGHVIGNHSWDHPDKPKDPVEQVTRTDKQIAKDLKITTHLFRPPYGILTNGMAAQAKKEKKAVILWSTSGVDWQRPTPIRIADAVLERVHPGGIILLHDGGGNRNTTVEALPLIIPRLQQKGYKFVTVPQLLAMRYVSPAPAKH
ncbi:MAG: polysaccharide deacetylase family protein [Abditibacteriaceae bacterium]